MKIPALRRFGAGREYSTRAADGWVSQLLFAWAMWASGVVLAAAVASTDETDGASGRVRVVSAEAPPVWVRTESGPRQYVKIGLCGAAGIETEVFWQDRPVGRVRLQGGVQAEELALELVENETVGVLELRVDGEVKERRDLTLRPPRLRELWVLPHSHVDIGYTHRQDEVIDIQIANLRKAMELARASADHNEGERFKWNPEAIWVLDHFWDRVEVGERGALVQAVRRGEVGVDALYANMLTGLCRPEELAQSLRHGPRWATRTGVPVESAAICDVPGWTWGLVTMLGQAGVKYFAIGPNYSARIGTVHVWANQPFYWLSPSGQERVLCYVVDNYHFLGNLEDQVLRQVDRLARGGYDYEVAPMFWVGTWPGGEVDNAPPDAGLVDKVVAWNQKFAAPRVRIALAAEFFLELERRHAGRLPAFAGDITPYWEDGAGSTSRETGMSRASAERLAQAEQLFARMDPAGRPPAAFEEAWRNVLLYSEHTWGAHNSISHPDDPFVLDQWAVKQRFALDADRQSRELLQAAVARHGSSMPSGAGRVVDVLNTTQWPRTELVILGAAETGAALGVETDRGRTVPSQRLASGELAFVASDVPGFGARRYRLSQRAWAGSGDAWAEGLVLRNRLLIVEIDGVSGAVKSLQRRGISGDFVDAMASVALNDFRYVLGPDAQGAQPNGPVSWHVIESGPLVAAMRIESSAPGCERLVREVRLVDGLDRVEFVNHVDRKAVRDKDAVHFGFGFRVPDGVVRMETPWAVVRPNVDQLPGSCRNWFTVQRWVDVSNAERGITWAPLEAPLIQVGGITANLMGPVAREEWLTQAIESSTIYSWAQNNHWFTNYKADQPGVTTFRYLLRPHAGGYCAIDAARFGMEVSRPLVVVWTDGVRPVPAPGLRLSSDQVAVETIKVTEDGAGTLVRLFGVTGRSTKVRLDWDGPKSAGMWLTDLSEQRLRRAERMIEVPGYGVTMVRIDHER
jgi:alpha-mannosidase